MTLKSNGTRIPVLADEALVKAVTMPTRTFRELLGSLSRLPVTAVTW